MKNVQDNIVITEIVENGPAHEAQLMPGDQVIQVDDLKASTSNKMDIINKIRDTKESPIKIKILRDGQEIEKEFFRKKIETTNIQNSTVNHFGQNIAYVKIGSFGDPSLCSDFYPVLNKIIKNQSGIILDLRNNPGGYINQTTCLLSYFLGPNIKVVEGYVKNWFNDIYKTEQTSVVTQLPLVVLVNENSASASELFSGAIQDLKRGWIVGQTTFGKGTYQDVTPNITLGISFIFTGGKFYLPSGTSPYIVGITPDILVPSELDRSYKKIEREADLYREIDYTQVTPRPNKRLSDIQKMNSCLSIKKSESLVRGQNKIFDYQLLVAEEVLNCSH